MRKDDVIEIIYLSTEDGTLSQRIIRILSAEKSYVQAYCYPCRQIRIFKKENFLASRPLRRAS